MTERVIKQGWYSRGFNYHPNFYDTINGKLTRVTNAEGIRLVEMGILPFTDSLRKYYKKRGIEIKA